MEIILQNENNLNISWHPGCFKIQPGHYVVGPIGRTGHNPNSLDNIVSASDVVLPNTTIPDQLSISFSLKNNDKDLYQSLVSLANNLKLDPELEIIINQPRLIHEKICAKPEYENKVRELEEANKIIDQKFCNLLSQLEELGCTTDDIGHPRYEIIPEEYYEWKHYYDYIPFFRIEIRCHKDTEFYKFMNKSGLLKKYFPQWYAEGKF